MATSPHLTAAQQATARLFVARLLAEASFTDFHLADLGMEWVPHVDPIIFVTEDGQQIAASDILQTGLVLVWSLLQARASEQKSTVEQLIEELGLMLAVHGMDS